jgi:drug/metabolite transporter (DMT)-like permease
MPGAGVLAGNQSREAAGFLVAAAFVCLAAVRDVYLGGLFQRASPLLIAIVAFSLCTVVFLPTAVVGSRGSLVLLRRRPREVLWVNISSATAWLAFLYALRLIEPTLVQILYSGIGPLSVVWIDRHFGRGGLTEPVTRTERLLYVAVIGALIVAAAVALTGLSGVGAQPLPIAALGIVLAAGGGIAISVSTMQCRRLNDAGVRPSALLALRYPATALSAAILASFSPGGLPAGFSWIDAAMATASLLIVVPTYVNQVAISLASPLTVRVVLATAPAIIFLVQLIEGRLSASPYSLAAAMLYAVVAIGAGFARHRVIRWARL